MVIAMKEENVAAKIREQIKFLQKVAQEMEAERLNPEAIGWRLRAVELGLRQLREAA